MNIEINSHRVNPANDRIKIITADRVGAGGAHHEYEASWITQNGSNAHKTISFQNGTIPENGVNGLTQEALLAIVEHRLQCFQAGPFACEENGKALAAVKDAMHWLAHRTLKRMARNVEGTHAK